MKTWKIILPLILCAISVGAVIWAKNYHRPLKLEECSDIYQRYAEMEQVEVTYLKNCRIIDSVQFDITFVTPTDTAVLHQILSEYFPAELEDIPYDTLLASESVMFNSYHRRVCINEKGEEMVVCDVVAADMRTRQLVFCHCDDEHATIASCNFLFNLFMPKPQL